METRATKNNSTSNAYYDTTAGYHPDLLGLVAEKQPVISTIISDSSPSSSFPFDNSEPFLAFNQAHSEVWSPLCATSKNKSQSGKRDKLSLQNQAYFNFPSSSSSPSSSNHHQHHQCCYPKINSARYIDYSVDSAYGSQAGSSADAQSVDDGYSCPRGSEYYTSSSFSSLSEWSSSQSSWGDDCARVAPRRIPTSRFAVEINSLTRPVGINKSLACHLCPWVGSTLSEKRFVHLSPVYIYKSITSFVFFLTLNRKHDARHNKIHKCELCNTSFGTPNDLERHRKSRHQETPHCEPFEQFKCFGRGCRDPEKLWARRDNFKAHIQRRHKDENENKLMCLYVFLFFF